jgi:hypothetical protein
MKNILLGLITLLLSACASITDAPRGNVHVLTYKPFSGGDPDAAPTSSVLTFMALKADDVCPSGWEKLREYHVGAPPDGSHHVWEIRCRK